MQDEGFEDLFKSDIPVLVSNESLMTDSMSRLLKLKRATGDATVIVFVRNQVDRILSLYNQGIKKISFNTLLSIERYVKLRRNWLVASSDYAAHVEMLMRLFDGRVHVLLFEDYVRDFGCLGRVFPEIMGVPEAELVIPEEKVNESIDWLMLPGARFATPVWRKIALDGDSFLNKAHGVDDFLKTRFPSLAQAKERRRERVAELLGGVFHASNRRLEALLGRPLPDVYYR